MGSDTECAGRQGDRPYVIVVGNEKGGTGKSTTAMHIAVALAYKGYAVGSIDLDPRQGTLTRYLANRVGYAERTGRALKMPRHRIVATDGDTDAAVPGLAPPCRSDAVFAEFSDCQFVVVDTPGNDSPLSRFGHANADTLVTPLNDSFLDIDVLARIDAVKREVLAPSVYTRMVWEQNNRRVAAGLAPIDWIVMRNRLSHIDARNKRDIAGLMGRLARRIGFRLAPGFGERVVFRELFLRGLTLLDLPEPGDDRPISPSRMAAQGELEDLLRAVGIGVGVKAA